MPKKSVGRKVASSYDVPFVGFGIKPLTLGISERAAVSRILGRQPSDEFMTAYCTIVATYIAHREAVTRAAPAAVQRRLEAVEDAIDILYKRLNDLDPTDTLFIRRFTLARFSQTQKYVGLGAFSDALLEFRPLMEEAIAEIEKEPKQGRMPAFAERGLAITLYQILFDESGQRPTAKRGGAFDRLVRCAFTQALHPRKDVIDLLRLCLRSPQSGLLQTFRSRPPKSGGLNEEPCGNKAG